ncbi:Cysteine-rich secretory protein LCCL domain-containing 2 [Cricetulus griseus]|uniref:Cysteine-rich secretory protein LCCL domain-containing 2 n=1 Tax=Cricetulus griseus TaxID=10029 RepID=G3GRX1_CRIGR|nr:Cysteine-rich secretory protein LCCL domain-containing 2 [Cricetulus griseus]
MSCLLYSVIPVGLALLVCGAQAFFLPNTTSLEKLLSKYQQAEPHSHSRVRRAIPWSDRQEILMLHNKLRGQVYPPSSNMEYMTWDEELERSAAAWAQECLWEHGPASLLVSIGQNLAVHWGRYRSPGFHVQSWYDEVKDYTYPYPHECNPWCPERCSGAMCTHYTQMVWATTNKVGCAVHTCRSMNVWGDIWENAVYLVCNYSPKGNWIGEAPYKHGRPCSECPPSYGGGCRNNLCYREEPYSQKPEVDEMNEVEPPPAPEVQPRVVRPSKPKKTPTINFMTQVVRCDTKMKDTCKGSTCNSKYKPSSSFTVSKVKEKGVDCHTTVAQLCPFEKPATHCPRVQCPARCGEEPSYWAPVFGTNIYADTSSICKAAVHAGVISDENGGYADVMPVDKKKSYVGSLRNGVQSER